MQLSRSKKIYYFVLMMAALPVILLMFTGESIFGLLKRAAKRHNYQILKDLAKAQ